MTAQPEIIPASPLTAAVTPLDDRERRQLGKLEEIVAQGIEQTRQVTVALVAIHDRRLYREYGTFADYLEKRWGFSRSRGYQLLTHGKVVQSMSTTVDIKALPTKERHTRELGRLEDPGQQAQAWEEAREAADGDEPTTAQVKEAVDKRVAEETPKKTREVMTSSESVEWFTPSPYVEAARALMGGIDLDPASCAEANEIVKAVEFFDVKKNGLRRQWFGNVFVNPPYGKTADGKSSQAAWLAKLLNEIEAGRVAQAVWLANAVTGTAWFQPLWERMLCFPRRIRFIAPAVVGKKDQPINSSVLAYFGPDTFQTRARFVALFHELGRCVLPGERWSAVVRD